MRLRHAILALSLGLASMALAAADTATLTAPEKLRSEPSAFASVVTVVHRLATVRIVDERRDWYQVEADGGRSGWLPRQSLQRDGDPAAATAPPATGPTAGGPDPRLIPRSAARASNHALILGLDPARARPDGDTATALARLMGVPDANIQQPAPDRLDADGLRRALAALDARLGADDRAFIELSGQSAVCALPAGELSAYLRTLARKADKLVVLTEGGEHCAPSVPASANVLALAGPDGTAAALLACLDGRAPLPAAGGLANGDDWRHCAQAQLERQRTRPGRIAVAGNPALAPAPGLASGAPVTPRRLLQTLHAQRSERREVTVGGLRGSYRVTDTLQFSVRGPAGGQLYVIAARDDGLILLHPSPAAPAERFGGSQRFALSARDIGTGPLRLLALVTDSPRNFQRAGFGGAGRFASAPADTRSLRDLPLEILGGDTNPTCLRAETRNLGEVQARQCNTAFGAALAELTITP